MRMLVPRPVLSAGMLLPGSRRLHALHATTAAPVVADARYLYQASRYEGRWLRGTARGRKMSGRSRAPNSAASYTYLLCGMRVCYAVSRAFAA
eukprot:533159-Rhodomonas_salina.1